MKTVYTDKYGILPLLMLGGSLSGFRLAYLGYVESNGSSLGLGLASGTLFFGLALKRLWDRRQAKRVGRDHTIVRIKNAPNK